MKKHTCLVCKLEGSVNLLKLPKVPTVANNSILDLIIAKNADYQQVEINQCKNCGFIFNSNFSPNTNLKSFSNNNSEYLKNIFAILLKNGIPNKKVIEIGGDFELLKIFKQNGFDVKGFDPNYQGDMNEIVKEDYSESFSDFNPGLIIIRNSLEKSIDPFGKIKEIAKINKYKGKTYIETSNFEWNYEQKSFSSIFNARSCYLTQKSISMFFDECEIGLLGEGENLYCIAETAEVLELPHERSFQKYSKDNFLDQFEQFQKTINKHEKFIVWGTEDKSFAFVQFCDENKTKIPFLVSTNLEFQGKFVPISGHEILEPNKAVEFIVAQELPIFIPNFNYFEEVKSFTKEERVRIFTWQ